LKQNGFYMVGQHPEYQVLSAGDSRIFVLSCNFQGTKVENVVFPPPGFKLSRIAWYELDIINLIHWANRIFTDINKSICFVWYFTFHKRNYINIRWDYFRTTSWSATSPSAKKTIFLLLSRSRRVFTEGLNSMDKTSKNLSKNWIGLLCIKQSQTWDRLTSPKI
jgi:hypothetical protein